MMPALELLHPLIVVAFSDQREVVRDGLYGIATARPIGSYALRLRRRPRAARLDGDSRE